MAKKINKKIVKKSAKKTTGTDFKFKLSKTTGTKFPPIGDETLHRARVLKKLESLRRLKNDIENGCYECEEQVCPPDYRGTHAINKEMRAKYKWRVWQVLGVMVGIAVLYVVIINVFNL